MSEKIKVLFYTELWANAGVESVIMNLFRNFDLSEVSVDIMASQNLTDFYDDEINRLGGKKIITLNEKYDSPAKRMMANKSAFQKAIRENHYDVVHLHMCNAAAMMYGKIAKECGVKVVAYHSHNTNLSSSHRLIKTIAHDISKYKYEKYADLLFSCSDLASKWMFTRKSVSSGKVQLVNNAIDLDKFEFDDQKRIEYRKKLGVENKFVVGHIGRFADAKNHSFLIDIFESIHKEESNSCLLLIGEGEDKPRIQEKVESLGLSDKVIFYGTTNEIPQMLWAMDAFVLPSFYEGNPMVGIEAQAASVPCFFSDSITKMCKLTDIVKYLSLNDSSKVWAKEVLKAERKLRVSQKQELQIKGYDIKDVSREVLKKYEIILAK